MARRPLPGLFRLRAALVRRDRQTVARVAWIVAALVAAFLLAAWLLTPSALPHAGGVALAQGRAPALAQAVRAPAIAQAARPSAGAQAARPASPSAAPAAPGPVAPATPSAEPAPTEPPPKPPFPPEAKPLLDADWSAWLDGLAALRASGRGHAVLVQALASEVPNPRRWRLAHHLMEWGTPEDVPLVAGLLEDAAGKERTALIAALEAIYPRPLAPVDLARAVAEFSFLPQDAVTPFAPETAGRWPVTDLAIQAYHQDSLPIRVIERAMALRTRTFDSRGALAEALQKQLPGRQWADFGERLLAPIFPVPARVSQAGVLRVGLTNPTQRPIVLELGFNAAFGRFEQTPLPRYVLVPPGERVLREVPVRLIAPADPGRPRVFLRAREVNVSGLIEVQKLEVALKR